MKIRNLKTAQDVAETTGHVAITDASPRVAEQSAVTTELTGRAAEDGLLDRQSLEIALLRARLQHLELVVETARSLLNANQDRLLRRLHDIPRELASLTAQLQRADPQASW